MNVKSFKTLTAASALALGAMVYAGSAHAVNVQSGSPTTVPIQATILNTFTVTTTTLDLGQLGVTPKVGDLAATTLAPAGVLASNDTGAGNAANARIAIDSTTPASPTVVTVLGFGSTQVKVDYTLCVDLTNGGSTFTLSALDDDLGAPPVGVGGVAGHGCTGPTQGNAVTDATGHLTFDVGATVKTTATAVAYPDGVYNGSFDITLSY